MKKSFRIYDLGDKEVINLADGARLGFVDDVEISAPEGQVLSVIIPGRPRFFGLFGREEDIVIPWSDIERVGEDIIFVRFDGVYTRSPKNKKHDYHF